MSETFHSPPHPANPSASPAAIAAPPSGNSTQAVLALIFGILSITGGCFLFGIPALILGRMELNAIRRGESSAENRGLALAGFILGIVSTLTSCCFVLFYIVIMAMGLTLGTLGSLGSYN